MKPDLPLERSNPVMNVSAAIAPPAAATPGRSGSDSRGATAPAGAPDAERTLVVRAMERDEEAFRMLVDLHRDAAYGLALRITRSHADAEDVAQEAFVRAWHALPRFRGDARFGTWLHRIVANRALDRARQRQTRLGRESELDAVAERPAPAAAERDTLLARRLERLLETLSPPQRAVVSLFYMQDQSVEDVAAALAMPENTVKTHLARARAALREAWVRESGGAAS